MFIQTLSQFALDRARVALSNGLAFGPPGAGYARMNLACAPGTITEADSRLAQAAGNGARSTPALLAGDGCRG